MVDVLFPINIETDPMAIELSVSAGTNASDISVGSDEHLEEIPIGCSSDLNDLHIAIDDNIFSVSVEINQAFNIIDTDVDFYPGPYAVTPDENVQTLNTDSKYLTENVIVYAVEAMSNDSIRSAVSAGWR